MLESVCEHCCMEPEPVTKVDFDAIIERLPAFWDERDPVELHHAGLRPLHFHALRHAAGSLIARHADARFVQEFLGHSRITTYRALHACQGSAGGS